MVHTIRSREEMIFTRAVNQTFFDQLLGQINRFSESLINVLVKNRIIIIDDDTIQKQVSDRIIFNIAMDDIAAAMSDQNMLIELNEKISKNATPPIQKRMFIAKKSVIDAVRTNKITFNTEVPKFLILHDISYFGSENDIIVLYPGSIVDTIDNSADSPFISHFNNDVSKCRESIIMTIYALIQARFVGFEDSVLSAQFQYEIVKDILLKDGSTILENILRLTIQNTIITLGFEDSVVGAIAKQLGLKYQVSYLMTDDAKIQLRIILMPPKPFMVENEIISLALEPSTTPVDVSALQESIDDYDCFDDDTMSEIEDSNI